MHGRDHWSPRRPCMVPSWGLTGRVYLGLEARPQPGISVHSMPIDGITPLLGASNEWVGRAEMSWRCWSGKEEGSHVNAIFTFPVLSNFIYVHSSLKKHRFSACTTLWFNLPILSYFSNVSFSCISSCFISFPPHLAPGFLVPCVRYRDTDFTGWGLRRFGLRVTGTNQSEGRRQWEARFRQPASRRHEPWKRMLKRWGMLKWKWF